MTLTPSGPGDPDQTGNPPVGSGDVVGASGDVVGASGDVLGASGDVLGPSGDPTDVELLAAALRADASDLDVYARVLTESLSEALPAGMVTVDRDRSLGDRLAGRPGLVTGVHVAVGDWQLDLAREHGTLQARCAQRVRGVVISSKPVTVDEWIRLLAARLAEQAKVSDSARAALEALVAGRPLS